MHCLSVFFPHVFTKWLILLRGEYNIQFHIQTYPKTWSQWEFITNECFFHFELNYCKFSCTLFCRLFYSLFFSCLVSFFPSLMMPLHSYISVLYLFGLRNIIKIKMNKNMWVLHFWSAVFFFSLLFSCVVYMLRVTLTNEPTDAV